MDRPPEQPPSPAPVRPDWAPPTGEPVADAAAIWAEGVADPADPLDVAASPDAWLSPRLLLVITVVAAVVLVATVVIALLYWITPATQPLTLPHPAQV